MAQTPTWRVLLIGGGMDHGASTSTNNSVNNLRGDGKETGLKHLVSSHCKLHNASIPSGLAENSKFRYFTYGGEQPDRSNWVQRRFNDLMFAGTDYSDMLELISEWRGSGFGVLIIGHSLGGATGYGLASRLPKHSSPVVLVTLDPVGRFTRGKEELQNAIWINVYAGKKKGTFGDYIAKIGGAWDDRPSAKSSDGLDDADHGSVSDMLNFIMADLLSILKNPYKVSLPNR